MSADYNPAEFIDVPKGWDCKRLLDCTIDQTISYGIVQPGQHNDDGIPVIRVNNFNNGQLDLSDVLRVSPEIEEKYKRTRLKGGEVLLTLVGSTGQSVVAPEELVGWNVPRAIAVIRPAPEVGSDWINICLQSKDTKHFLDVRANTTVQKTLNLKDVRDIPVLLPPEETRNAIASIATTLTNKIQLNHQINQTLEQMAQAIFKSWFVDFEPVKAKIAVLEAGGSITDAELAAMQAISGKDSHKLTQMATEQPEQYAELQANAAQFPATMQASELGEIPEGWEVSQIGDEVTVVGGGTPSTKNPDFWVGGNFHWTTPKDLSNLNDKVLIDTERKITSAGLAKISSGQLPVDTVLMSSRAPVGYLALAKIPVAVNQGYIAMKCDKRLSPEYVLQWCESRMDEIKGRASGTTFAEISKKNFKVIAAIVPQQDLIISYTKQVKTIYEKVEVLARESGSLADLRGTLLPQLLSGSISMEGMEA